MCISLKELAYTWQSIDGNEHDFSSYSNSPYVSPSGMKKLMEHFNLHLPDGTVLICYARLHNRMPVLDWIVGSGVPPIGWVDGYGYVLGYLIGEEPEIVIRPISNMTSYWLMKASVSRIMRKTAQKWYDDKDTFWFDQCRQHAENKLRKMQK